MKDKSLESISTWSKSKQVNKIEKIVKTFPTAKDFKKAVLASNDPKAIQTVKILDDNADRSTYIDFLQNVFIKHSSTGKHLLSALVGLGAGAGLAYLGAKEAKKYAEKQGITDQTASQALSAPKAGKSVGELAGLMHGNVQTADEVAISQALTNNPMSALGIYVDRGSTGALKHAAVGAVSRALATAALTKGNIGRKLGHGLASAISPDLADRLAVSAAEADQKELRKYMAAGGGAGLVGGGVAGGGLTNAIQSWREKKLQKKLDDLKNG